MNKQTIIFAVVAVLLAAASVWLLNVTSDLNGTVKEISGKMTELESAVADHGDEINRVAQFADSTATALKLLTKRVKELEDD